MSISSDRRQFLRFLAGSPLFAPAFAQPAANPKVDEILNVLELEEMARKALPSAHWGYMASGVDDDLTIRANREGFDRWLSPDGRDTHHTGSLRCFPR